MPAVEHSFTGPAYTIGVEEELMIVDAETLDLSNSIESLLSGIPQDLTGEVKPELLESGCEIATTPGANTQEAGEQLRELRRAAQATAAAEGLAIGSAGAHPLPVGGGARGGG